MVILDLNAFAVMVLICNRVGGFIFLDSNFLFIGLSQGIYVLMPMFWDLLRLCLGWVVCIVLS